MDLDEENKEQNSNKYSINDEDNTDNPNNIHYYNYSINDPNNQKQPTKNQYPIINPNNNIQEEKKNNEEEEMSINLIIKENGFVNFKIPINNNNNMNNVWEKTYHKNEKIGKVLSDYFKDIYNSDGNNINIDAQMNYLYNKFNLNDSINELLPDNPNINNNDEESRTFSLNYSSSSESDILQFIGKPFYDPFEILCFSKKEKKFKKLTYSEEIIQKTQIFKFGITSAYCNGDNHLYISGGEDSQNFFWDIDLNNNIINNPIMMAYPKKLHSMIYIKNFAVFIVGGSNNLETFFYHLDDKKIYNWGRLNILRVEPSLQIIQNKLYCIDNINSTNNKIHYSIEVTDLSVNNGKWKLIRPTLTNNAKNRIFTQKLFGVAKSKDNNIIFLGGTLNKDNIRMNFMYNIINNKIHLSNSKFVGFNLKEKTFCPFNSKYDYILTDFPKNKPKIAFFNKKKEKIELIDFTSHNEFLYSKKNDNNQQKLNPNLNKSPILIDKKNDINNPKEYNINNYNNHNNKYYNNNNILNNDNKLAIIRENPPKIKYINNKKQINSPTIINGYSQKFQYKSPYKKETENNYKLINDKNHLNGNINGVSPKISFWNNNELNTKKYPANINGVSPNISFWNDNELNTKKYPANINGVSPNISFWNDNELNIKKNSGNINGVSPNISFWSDNELNTKQYPANINDDSPKKSLLNNNTLNTKKYSRNMSGVSPNISFWNDNELYQKNFLSDINRNINFVGVSPTVSFWENDNANNRNQNIGKKYKHKNISLFPEVTFWDNDTYFPKIKKNYKNNDKNKLNKTFDDVF